MEKKVIVLFFCIITTISSCGQSTNNTMVEKEKRIILILDTLKNDYFWQNIPSDLLGYVPPNFDFEAETKKYPFRIERYNYRLELDSLMDKNLSESFLISLLNREYRNQQKYFCYDLTTKLFTYQTDSSYAALYHFFIKNPKYYDIAVELVKRNKYYNKIREYILELDNNILVEHYFYLHVFEEETDKLLLDKIANYVQNKLDSEEFFAAYLKVSALNIYYEIESESFENDKIVRKYREEMSKYGNGEKFQRARNNYWRTYCEKVLEFYKKQ
ncbi:hypothetical protein [Aquimarina sp. I32.4]|uniref:hypothetical protein n=1 Tax=Aquimarina sp. I32.4 TaxID=2053903 RepID=UPI000CDE9EAF|nr:hypothetical protein [Aquimarina sp. I32.4]